MANADSDAEEQVQAVGEAAEALWDAARRFQDLLDDLEGERIGRWAAYTAFREVGSLFRFALERLQMEKPIPALVEVIAAFRDGARAGFEASADLATVMRDGGLEAIETGVERLTLASQQFVRGRYLLQRFLDARQGEDRPADGGPEA